MSIPRFEASETEIRDFGVHGLVDEHVEALEIAMQYRRHAFVEIRETFRHIDSEAHL